jgi:hypothetical protein
MNDLQWKFIPPQFWRPEVKIKVLIILQFLWKLHGRFPSVPVSSSPGISIP